MSTERKKEYQIIIAGRGGQGILLAGYILGLSFVKEGYYVVNSEKYSAETRGGDSISELIISREEEPFLIRVRRADLAIFMFKDQAEKYSPLLSKDATVLIDSTYITDVGRPVAVIYKCPFSDIARNEVGTIRTANMVMLGYLVAVTKLLYIETLKDVIKEKISERWRDLNLKAVDVGYKYGLSHKK